MRPKLVASPTGDWLVLVALGLLALSQANGDEGTHAHVVLVLAMALGIVALSCLVA